MCSIHGKQIRIRLGSARTILAISSLAVLPGWAAWADSSGIEGLRAALARRDKALSSLQFDWHVEHQTTKPGVDPKRVKQWENEAATTVRMDAAQKGITDEARIAKKVQAERRMAHLAGKKVDMSYESLHAFTRDGERTEAHATIALMEPELEVTTEWHQWYGDGWGALYADRTVGKDGKNAVNQGPYIWREKGDGAMRDAPFIACMDISPSEFVLLTGKNPFNMYGDHWETVATTTTSTVLRSVLTTGQLRPATVELTLDKNHGAVPRLINLRIRDKKWETYEVKRWTHHAGEWMPAEVDYAAFYPPVHVHRTWTLHDIGPGHPVKINIPINTDIADVRLVSDEPDLITVEKAMKASSKGVVWYPWGGRLPDLAQLASMNKNNPSRKADWHNLLPGVVLIACGGIWFLRMRGKTKQQEQAAHDA